MLRTVDRVLVGVAGLLLLAVGGAVLAVGLGASPPSWWLHHGRHDVLLTTAERTRWRAEAWWWPTVVAALALLVLLALWWLVAVLRRRRLGEVLVDTGDGAGRCCAAGPWKACSPPRPAAWTASPTPTPG